MKKWFSILCIVLFLASSTELSQLLKIPVFVEHFLEHEKTNSDLTLIDFIKIHYNHPQKDADYKTDQKLPFVRHSVHINTVYTVNPLFFFTIKKTVIIINASKIPSRKEFLYDHRILNSIWQPPKFS